MKLKFENQKGYIKSTGRVVDVVYRNGDTYEIKKYKNNSIVSIDKDEIELLSDNLPKMYNKDTGETMEIVKINKVTIFAIRLNCIDIPYVKKFKKADFVEIKGENVAKIAKIEELDKQWDELSDKIRELRKLKLSLSDQTSKLLSELK